MTSGAAIRAALEAEYAVIYGYGVAGGRLRGRDLAFAQERLATHQEWRDQLLAVASSAADRPAPLPAYELPFPVEDPAAARRLAVRLEDGAAGAAWDVVAASRPATAARRLGVALLADVAVAAADWRTRGHVDDDPAFPGAPPGFAQADSQPSTTPTTSPSSTTTASGSTS